MADRDRESRIFREPVENVFSRADQDDDPLQIILGEVPYYSSRVMEHDVLTFNINLDAVFFSIFEFGRREGAPNSAQWLFQHFAESLGLSVVNSAATGRRQRLSVGYSEQVVVAPLLTRVDRSASTISWKIRQRRTYGLLHLVAALLEYRSQLLSQLSKLDISQTALNGAFQHASQELLSWIADHHADDEDLNAWIEVLGGNRDQPDDTEDVLSARQPRTKAAASVHFIPGISTDRPGIDAGDSLGVDPDVQAFARLICLKDARPPLSIGLFGGWGAGKSTFMERLETAIDTITQTEAKRRENVKAGTAEPQRSDAPGFLARVAHIRFNAWQYSDANLWASLTTEFFDQLRAGGHGRQGCALHDKLMARVKEHVHGLTGSADAARKALDESKSALQEAEKQRDEAVAKVNTVNTGVFAQALDKEFDKHFQKIKEQLVKFGLADDGSDDKAIKSVVDLAGRIRTLPGKVGVVFDAVWNSHLRWLAVCALGAIIVAGLLGIFVPSWISQLSAWLAGSGALVAVGLLVKPLRVINGLLLDTAAIADKLKEADAAVQEDLVAKEIEVRAKAEEVKTRQVAAAQAETALASYAGPPGTPSSPRLLHFLLNDNPDTKVIEGEIGLISRARRLFQAVDKIAAEERLNENPDEDVPERIVLYIDDLDRCSHDQVYAVLQAVHLLLAFELFVVVVGVDVAWVEEAITRQLRDGPQTQGDDEGKRRKRAIDYLQKIFQIPFWLKPLSTDGNDGGSYGRFVGALVGPVAVADLSETHKIEVTGVEVKDLAGEDGQLVFETEAGTDEAADEEDIPAEKAIDEVRALATMRLDPREVDFLKYPAIGAVAAHDPRGVKRMINTYRLARARMSGEELGKLLDVDDPTYPILALFAAIETGQPIEEIADVIDRDLRTENFGATDIGEIIKARVAEQDREWRSVIEKKAPAEKVIEAATLHGRWVAVAEGLAKARIVRKTHAIFVADCLPISRLVRRYSFSRKQ